MAGWPSAVHAMDPKLISPRFSKDCKGLAPLTTAITNTSTVERVYADAKVMDGWETKDIGKSNKISLKLKHPPSHLYQNTHIHQNIFTPIFSAKELMAALNMNALTGSSCSTSKAASHLDKFSCFHPCQVRWNVWGFHKSPLLLIRFSLIQHAIHLTTKELG